MILGPAAVGLGQTLSGRAYEGNVGDQSIELAGVTVSLYGAPEAGGPRTHIVSQTSGANGWYGLPVAEGFEHYYIVAESGPDTSYTFEGATSVGGTASGNEIHYSMLSAPLDEQTLTGNKFWYQKEGQEPPENRPPVANDDSATTPQDTAVDIDVLANDTDPDGDPLHINSATDPPHGTTVNHGGNLTYTPDPGFTGTDTFDYTAGDGKGGTDTATVTVTVSASDEPWTVCQGVKWNDIDGDGSRDAAEPGLSGWMIYLDTNTNGQWDSGEPSDTTDEQGNFDIRVQWGPPSRTITLSVREVMQAGWEQTSPSTAPTVSFGSSQMQTISVDFGNRRTDTPPEGEGAIRGVKFNDLNGNGQRDPDEPGADARCSPSGRSDRSSACP